MTYRLTESDPTMAAFLRRVAGEQLAAGVEALEGDDPHEAVHGGRKRVKRVRALLRLVRGGFDGFDAENGYLRDAARLVSDFRDRQAAVETLDRLAALDGAPDLAGLRRVLADARDAAARRDEVRDRIATFRSALESVRRAAADWELAEVGWEAVAPGLHKSYKKGRKALKTARKESSEEHFHDLRKRVKDHRAHARLLRPLWPGPLRARARELSRLASLLGERHDLDTFAPHVEDGPLDAGARTALRETLTTERARLDTEALTLGARVYADKPGTFVKRWGKWYGVWRE
ncbi:lysyl-tRNA synthetase [Oceanicola granulosus HTCC2516]|uniref:Lysyl-tRNA synthetase n=1 Tax=Oceanicola granulosus (strain ATCC BAA-861 / DSM 15982 / KCTC 12143 / HTCC2516) TaxID=314256 RepID=Q2CB02_OCEGH|nr:CHAD domain-containing protein [Oceanicola granulosus]EAR49874.1 lysyl-tRNA synthetase [Oceanicola granulosus HTCC2516]